MDDSEFVLTLLWWPPGRDADPQILGHTYDRQLTARARELIALDHKRELLVLTGLDDSSAEEQAIER